MTGGRHANGAARSGRSCLEALEALAGGAPAARLRIVGAVAHRGAVDASSPQTDVIARVRTGDAGAEAEVCRELAPRIRVFARRRIQDRDAVEDFVQDTLVIVLEALREGRIPTHAELGSFALSTCRWRIVDAQRTHARRTAILTRNQLDASRPSDPVALLMLRQCIATLDSRAQRVVFESFFGARGSEAIAAQLGTTDANVRVVRHRALARLRDCVEAKEAS